LKRHRSAASRAIVLKLGRTVETDDLYSRAEFRDDRTAGRRAVTIRSAVDGAFLFLPGNPGIKFNVLRFRFGAPRTSLENSGFPGSGSLLSGGSEPLKRYRSAASRAIVMKLGRTVETDDVYILVEFRDDRTAGRRAVTIRSSVDGAF
jgi:hypothetical protein